LKKAANLIKQTPGDADGKITTWCGFVSTGHVCNTVLSYDYLGFRPAASKKPECDRSHGQEQKKTIGRWQPD
jgi:hypothetical protein